MQMQMRMMHRSKWLVPGFSVALGFVYLAVQRANDDPGGGLVIGLVVITAIIAAVFYELARGGDPRRRTPSSAPSAVWPTSSRSSCSSAAPSRPVPGTGRAVPGTRQATARRSTTVAPVSSTRSAVATSTMWPRLPAFRQMRGNASAPASRKTRSRLREPSGLIPPT